MAAIQLEVTIRQAHGLKHNGKHSIELILDGHDPVRTPFVEDDYDMAGNVVQPKEFRQAGRQVIRLRGGLDRYSNAWLHVAVIHQRMIRQDKRAAEAHIPFSQVARGLNGWVALEHKDQFGGKLYIISALREPRPQAPQAGPELSVSEAEIEEQRMILASIQAEQAAKAAGKSTGKGKQADAGSAVAAVTSQTSPAVASRPLKKKDPAKDPSWGDLLEASRNAKQAERDARSRRSTADAAASPWQSGPLEAPPPSKRSSRKAGGNQATTAPSPWGSGIDQPQGPPPLAAPAEPPPGQSDSTWGSWSVPPSSEVQWGGGFENTAGAWGGVSAANASPWGDWGAGMAAPAQTPAPAPTAVSTPAWAGSPGGGPSPQSSSSSSPSPDAWTGADDRSYAPASPAQAASPYAGGSGPCAPAVPAVAETTVPSQAFRGAHSPTAAPAAPPAPAPAPAPAAPPPVTGEVSQANEVNTADYQAYSYHIAQQLARGHDSIGRAILTFMEEQFRLLPANSAVVSDFAPFEVKGEGSLDRIAVDITVQRRVEEPAIRVSYASRWASTADIGSEDQHAQQQVSPKANTNGETQVEQEAPQQSQASEEQKMTYSSLEEEDSSDDENGAHKESSKPEHATLEKGVAEINLVESDEKRQSLPEESAKPETRMVEQDIAETANEHEVKVDDYRAFAMYIAETLSRGHEDIEQSIISFMQNNWQVPNLQTVTTDFMPFEVYSRDELKHQRIMVEIALIRKDDLYRVSYRARCATLVAAPEAAATVSATPLPAESATPSAPSTTAAASPTPGAAPTAVASTATARSPVSAPTASASAPAAPTALPSAPLVAASPQALPQWMQWRDFLVQFGDMAVEQSPAASSSAVPITGPHTYPVGGGIPEPTGRRRALLIGANYVYTAAQLHGSHNDVEGIRNLLLRLGFEDKNILCLLDGQPDLARLPTRRNILAAMRWLAHAVVPGDVLFFHFSGHGSQVPDPKQDGMDDTISPVDLQWEGQITQHQLFESLVRNLDYGVRLTAILDCCVPGIALGLPISCDPKLGWVEEADAYHTLGDVVCLSSVALEEPSAESLQKLCVMPGGMITTAFLKALSTLAARRTGPVTYLELLSQVRDNLAATGLPWQPRLSASQAFDPSKRLFRFFDAVPNGNAEVGLRIPRRTKGKRRWCGSDGVDQALVLPGAAPPPAYRGEPPPEAAPLPAAAH